MTFEPVGNYGASGVGANIYSQRIDQGGQVNRAELQKQNIRNNDAELNRPVESFQPNTGEKPDFAAINLMKNSFPDPQQQESRVQRFSLDEFVSGASSKKGGSLEQMKSLRQEVIEEAKMSEAATTKTSQEIAEESAGSRELTPAQQRGVEQYTRVQNYQDPTSLSMAGAQTVA